MTKFTEGRHGPEFILSEATFHRSRDAVTIASGAGVVKAGTVLGKVSASGKYVPSPATGSDGSQTGVAIALYDADATSADVDVAAITRDAEIKAFALTYEGTVNDDTKKAAKRSQLAAVGIISR